MFNIVLHDEILIYNSLIGQWLVINKRALRVCTCMNIFFKVVGIYREDNADNGEKASRVVTIMMERTFGQRKV